MSVIIKARGTGVLDNVFIFYDFKQVRDAVLVIMFAKQLGCWEKVLIYNTTNGWEADILKNYLEDDRYGLVSKKLKLIFNETEKRNRTEITNIGKLSTDEGYNVERY